MKSDRNQDYHIDDSELNILAMRMNALPNIKCNEQAFRRAMKKDKGSIMAFLNNHLNDDVVISKEKIFVF